MKTVLKSIISAFIIFSLIKIDASAQYIYPVSEGPGYDENCTTIMVGRLASTDGSVITSHTCDGNYRTWLNVVPAMTFEKGTKHPVYWGMLHTEEEWDKSRLEYKGEIDEAASTFAYLNTAYPCLNEKQLAMGETTIYGREELRNEQGLFLIEALQKIALQRCSTARDAIKLMGRLAEEYGYADLAECLTVADPKEVWHFEIAGSGKGKPSALWCAQRIPDDHVGVGANIPRISTVDFNNSDFFMFSSDLRERAKKLGYWDGKEPLKFWKVINGKKPYAIREYFIFKTLAPSLNITMNDEELPFSVKPGKKVSPRDVMKFFRETYEGTEFDMTKNLLVTVKSKDKDGNETEKRIKSPAVSNWMNSDLRNLLNELKPGVIERQRTIAISACSYSHVIQCRSWLPDEVGAVAWFSFDNPGQSPRIPIYSGTTRLPEAFSVCGQHRYRPEAAIWSFRETNRLSSVGWAAGRELIEPAVKELEDKAFLEQPELEKKVTELVKEGKSKEAKEAVTAYTAGYAYTAMGKWKEMKAILWGSLGRGF
jgi:dipeptidase